MQEHSLDWHSAYGRVTKYSFFEETVVKNQANVPVVVQPSPDLTKQNIDFDDVTVLAGMSAFAIFAVFVGVGWWCLDYFFGKPSEPPKKRRGKPVDDDPVDTNKIPLYQENP